MIRAKRPPHYLKFSFTSRSGWRCSPEISCKDAQTGEDFLRACAKRLLAYAEDCENDDPNCTVAFARSEDAKGAAGAISHDHLVAAFLSAVRILDTYHHSAYTNPYPGLEEHYSRVAAMEKALEADKATKGQTDG